MSDARALLRQQQASRQINHPLAVYSASGALSCLLCDTLVKTEGLWNPHLRSSGHRARVEAQSDRDRDRDRENAGVKRPARDEGDNRLQSPKKRARPEEEEDGEDKVRRGSLGLGVGVEITMATRPATPGRGGQMGISQFEAMASGADVTMAEPEAPVQSVAGTTQEDGKGDEVDDDDDDWAAFQADIAATTATFGGDATVSAAAKTAEQIAEEAQAETGQKKEKVEVRIEEEREEAKERLAEEFEEMEELERKVRELKERRERLKGVKLAGIVEEKAEVKKVEKEELDDSDEDEDEDEDDWAGFRFKGAIN